MDNESRDQINNFTAKLEKLSEESGLAIVLVDDQKERYAANNNSICGVLSRSEEFSPLCAKFCGKAFENSRNRDDVISQKCYAGISYQAIPLKTVANMELTAIIGRSFLKSEDYRNATFRALDGDWNKFSSDKLFKNTLLSSSETEISKLTKQIQKLTSTFAKNTTPPSIVAVQPPHVQTPLVEPPANLDFEQNNNPPVKAQAPRASLARHANPLSLLDLDYQQAFTKISDFLLIRNKLTKIAWLENRKGMLEGIWATDEFAGQNIQISIPADDPRFLDVWQKETALELRERKNPHKTDDKRQVISLFPLVVSGKVRNAIIVGDKLESREIKHEIAEFFRSISPEIEILRLRETIKRQSFLTKAYKKLNQALSQIDQHDFWSVLVQNATEFIGAERGSILIFDEETNEFRVKAAIGNRSDFLKELQNDQLGERIARNVLKNGKPLVVRDTSNMVIPIAPHDWQYKSHSFISYPIIISGKRIGVLNLTDKKTGKSFGENDLELLHSLAPQIAIALDRTSLQRKAGEFEQLSITDSLTGLLNRRYLEERMAEELNRSQRHGYPMSFMMIDVDAFKSYNDNFGHPEGDKALQLVGHCLKAALRGADVAARYGGEEFSILLPQTTLKEAASIADRIRQRVEETQFPNRQVTVSIGVATCCVELKTYVEIIEAADKALYRAKKKGRNNVQIFRKSDEIDDNF